ncbi:MAG: hypothetical protein AAF415_09230 [Pseudomonadota bacterium]
MPAAAGPGNLSGKLDQLQTQARVARDSPADQARIARELRRLEVLNQPFFGIEARRDQLLLDKLQAAVTQGPQAGPARSPVRLRNRRTRLMDLSPPEVSLGLEVFD